MLIVISLLHMSVSLSVTKYVDCIELYASKSCIGSADCVKKINKSN